MKMLIKYRDAFSLRDEIGECPNLKADIKVIDDSPFFVRPFPISENDKSFMDDQMGRLVSLGILSKNSTSHTSPVMLIEIKVDTVVSGTFKDYYEKLKKNLQYMGERLQKFRSQRLDLLNKDREYQAFEVGQIVYMFQARGSVVETGSRKIRCNYIGPLVIFKAVGPNQFLLMSLDGLVYPHLIEQSRLKAGTIWTTKGNVNNLADLRKALSTGLSIGAN